MSDERLTSDQVKAIHESEEMCEVERQLGVIDPEREEMDAELQRQLEVLRNAPPIFSMLECLMKLGQREEA